MPVTLDNFTNLTAPQKVIAQAYIDLAEQINQERDSDIVPNAAMTYKQAKTVDGLCREMNTLIGKMQQGAKYVLNHRLRENKAAFEAANA